MDVRALRDRLYRAVHAVRDLRARLAAVGDVVGVGLGVQHAGLQALVLALEGAEARLAQALESQVGHVLLPKLAEQDLERRRGAEGRGAEGVVGLDAECRERAAAGMRLGDAALGERGVAPALDLVLGVEEGLRMADQPDGLGCRGVDGGAVGRGEGCVARAVHEGEVDRGGVGHAVGGDIGLEEVDAGEATRLLVELHGEDAAVLDAGVVFDGAPLGDRAAEIGDGGAVRDGEGDLHIGPAHEIGQGRHHAVGDLLLGVAAELHKLFLEGQRRVEVRVLALVDAEAELAQTPDALVGQGCAVRGQARGDGLGGVAGALVR